MICKRCKREAPPDPETGYDADDLCPECEEEIEAEEFAARQPIDLGDLADYEADMANDCAREES